MGCEWLAGEPLLEVPCRPYVTRRGSYAAEAPTPAGDTGYVNDVNVGLASADVTRRSTRQATNEALFCACTPH